jgi:hypothetical protein
MRDSNREYIRRHAKVIGVVTMVLGGVLSAFFFPGYMHVSVGALVVLFAVFYVWAEYPLQGRGSDQGVITIRQQFKRARTLFTRITVPMVALWCVGVIFYGTRLSKLQTQAWAVGGGVVLFFIAWLFIKDKVRCPRCGTDFKQDRIAKVGRWSMDARGTEDLWDRCPHCGVSFDEPYRP